VILRLYGSTDKDVVRVDFVCMVHKKQWHETWDMCFVSMTI
jgi:hypothetical protein